jgi:hypothetical protein
MGKYVFYAFKGDAMCFMHVLLNALDMESKGMTAKIVIEGEAVVLVKKMIESGNPLFKETIAKGLIDCICKACSAKMGVLEYNENCGIPLNGDMSGHPPMAAYARDGFEIITL